MSKCIVIQLIPSFEARDQPIAETGLQNATARAQNSLQPNLWYKSPNLNPNFDRYRRTVSLSSQSALLLTFFPLNYRRKF
ncbi:hypothetical protein L2E82_32789 [Cichorium intybus]|uniref:Uncharacterized protein n=1 Tax=Cichorium intybus TaxID=13427 RepID=A0ACB9BIM6_CICIN|nr:hypothetical protein L2E82_32789 [Cichorium intybus]